MTVAIGRAQAGPPLRFLFTLLACFALSAVAALLLLILNFWALALVGYVLLGVLAAVRPRTAVVAVLVIAISLEPAATDYTRHFAAAVYQLPPGWENALGLTTSPLEMATVIAAISLFARGTRPVVASRLPLVVYYVPVAVVLGMLYGLYKGAPANLVYHESRGMMVGFAIFYIAMVLGPGNIQRLAKIVAGASLALATLAILRYFLVIRTGNLTVSPERAFSHESSLILGTALIIGIVAFVRARNMPNRLGLVAYCAVIMLALLVTGRRAATLMVLVGLASVALMMVRQRPALVLSSAIPLAILGGVYLTAFWNTEYGALAQPARAIRSQIDPGARDESSDTYREIEKRNVLQTINVNKVFGVGFGREFISFEPLPDLTSFWPLQHLTPHQNILWLWLKLGPVGMAAFLTVITLALQRCMRAAWRVPVASEGYAPAVVLFAALLMALAYSTVDLGLTGAREISVLATAAGISLAGLRSWPTTAENTPEGNNQRTTENHRD